MRILTDELKRAKTIMENINNENERYLEVINENDEVVGTMSRKDIHRLGLFHREVHVWLFDVHKSVFFQKRGIDRPSAGLLDATAGGHVNQGEKYIEAAIRELREETGLHANPKNLIFLKKIRISEAPPQNIGGLSNNSIRSIYIYSTPTDEEVLGKGNEGGLQKLSRSFLLNIPQEYTGMFLKETLTKEIPLILDYLK